MSARMVTGLALALSVASAAEGQSLKEIGGPANLPPPGFKGAQFVDSRGCLFMRAGYGEDVTWVARVDRQHKPICGMVPTDSAEAALAKIQGAGYGAPYLR